jgi:hypothetical protein
VGAEVPLTPKENWLTADFDSGSVGFPMLNCWWKILGDAVSLLELSGRQIVI